MGPNRVSTVAAAKPVSLFFLRRTRDPSSDQRPGTERCGFDAQTRYWRAPSSDAGTGERVLGRRVRCAYYRTGLGPAPPGNRHLRGAAVALADMAELRRKLP